MENLPTPLVTISLEEYEYLKNFMNEIKCSLKEPEYARVDAKTGSVYILSSMEAEMAIKDRISELESQNRAIERELIESRRMYMMQHRENIDLNSQKTSLEIELMKNLYKKPWWQFLK